MKFIRKHIKIITIIILLIIATTLVLLKVYLNNNSNLINKEIIIEEKEIITFPLKEETITDTNEIEKETIFVDIKGAVVTPGVYEIESNKKVIDVITLAGGLTEYADTSLINLAKQVTNEMVVIIYTKEEVEKAKQEEPIIKIIEKKCICPEIKNDACLENSKDDTKEETNSKKVNINTATIEELQTLDGIGESKAKSIITYREEKGKFNNIEELLEVSGIGESLYESIKENITV